MGRDFRGEEFWVRVAPTALDVFPFSLSQPLPFAIARPGGQAQGKWAGLTYVAPTAL